MLQVMKGCCSIRSSIPSPLVCDKTYNMSIAFVTSVAFECRALEYQDSRKGKHPTLIAACLVHTRSRYLDFQPFFNQLYVGMKGDDHPGMIQCNGDILCDETYIDGDGAQCVGADGETPLVEAMKDGLRCPNYIVCQRHLKQNIENYLQKGGCDLKTRVEITDAIFGGKKDKGLLGIESQLEYVVEYTNFSVKYQDYLSQKVLEKLKYKLWHNCIAPKASNHAAIRLPWLSNIIESINARLKVLAQFKKLQIDDLTRLIEEYLNAMIEDLKRALYGQGPYKLTKGREDELT